MTIVGSEKMVVYDDVAENKIIIYDKGIDCMAILGEDMDFDNPNTFTMWDEMSSYSDQFQKILPVHPAYYMTPTEGMIILFPSSLYHKVDVNQSEEDRISVSFNIGR